MANSSKKQTFLHGAALLAMATALVKIIGAIYRGMDISRRPTMSIPSC